MNDIQQYKLAYGGMTNMSTDDLMLDHECKDIVWCKYSDVEPLEKRITKLTHKHNDAVIKHTKLVGKVLEQDNRIAELIAEVKAQEHDVKVITKPFMERITKLEKFIDELAEDSDLSPVSDWRKGM